MSILRRLLGVTKKAPKGRIAYLKGIARKRAAGLDIELSPKDPTLIRAVSELQDYISYKKIKEFQIELNALMEGIE